MNPRAAHQQFGFLDTNNVQFAYTRQRPKHLIDNAVYRTCAANWYGHGAPDSAVM
jgi:hypothetical protein